MHSPLRTLSASQATPNITVNLRVFVVSLGLALLHANSTLAETASDVYVPEVLEPWVDWVLHNESRYHCPFDSQDEGTQTCMWVSEIGVEVRREEPTGASFKIDVHVFAESLLQLPRSNTHRPHDVRLNGEIATLGGGNGTPRLTLPVGKHLITGELVWNENGAPQYLHIPAAAIVSLNVDTEGELRPFLDNDHKRLWLTQNTESIEPVADTLSVKVFRQLVDGLPQRLTTYVELAVGGNPRVVDLGNVIPEDFSLIGVISQVPASINAEGQLSVLVSRGEHIVSVRARANRLINSFTYKRAGEDWPSEEIWGFEPNRELRVVSVEGPVRVNLDQVKAPNPMLGSDVYGYIVSSDAAISLVEEQRGNVNPNPAKFSISRNLWLNFDGSSFVVADKISATTDTELRIAANYLPGRVLVDNDLRLITYGDPESKTRPGINLDKRASRIQAVSEVERTGRMSSNGWDVDSFSLDAILHLPPGWRLMGTFGIDKVEDSWLSSWSIWDVFIGLLLVSLVFRFAGPIWATLVAFAVLLTYQDNFLPTVGWLILAGLVYLHSLVKTEWFRSASSVIFWILAVVVAVITIYHAAFTARYAIFPQFEPRDRDDVITYVQSGMAFEPEFDQEYRVRDRSLQAPQPKETIQVVGSRLPVREDLNVGADPDIELEDESQTYRVGVSAPALTPDFGTSSQGVTIQTGPGTPSWEWRSASLEWSGPVEKDQSFSLVLLPPWATRIIAALGALLALGTIGFLVAIRSKTAQEHLPKMLQGILPLLALLVLLPNDAWASIPDSRLLQQLQHRLTQPPDCLPDCAFLENAQVSVDEDELKLALLIHAEDKIGVALPQSSNSWNPDSILVNETASPLSRGPNGETFVLLDRGNHIVSITADVSTLTQFDIDFPIKPSRIDIDAPSWLIEGLVEGKLKSSQVTLARQTPGEFQDESSLLAASQPVQPYVLVQRALSLTYEPTVNTIVRRIAPLTEAFTVQIPLLPNETVLNTRGTVKDGQVTLSFAENQRSHSWSSQIYFDGEIQLTAPKLDERKEEWSVRGSDFWSFEYEGITPIQSNFNHTVFSPRSEETLNLVLTRPDPVPGNTLTVESAHLDYSVGNRSHEADLILRIFASQSADLEVNLPDGADVQRIIVGEEDQPIPATSRIVLPVQTGLHSYEVEWMEDSGAGLVFSTSEVQLGKGARNIDLTIRYPLDRWTLFLGGPTLGAAVMFWAIVIVVLVVAVGLSRLPNIPITTTDAVLFSLGATLINLWALLFVGAWFLATWVRSRKKEIDRRKFFYYLKQVAFIALSLVGLLTLVALVPSALLGNPDMHIAGHGSSWDQFNWFADVSGTTLPTAWVFSLPGWIFLIAMLAWSLWLAFALPRWTRAAWSAVSQPELWPPFDTWLRYRERHRARKEAREARKKRNQIES